MKKFTLLFVIIIACIVGVSLGSHIGRTQKESIYMLPTPTSFPIVATPETLYIPRIDVRAAIESVGLDDQQRMDVPHNPIDVAWYKLGPKPGEKGNAVIDGHVDLVTGAPSVFWNLKQLAVGDRIDVTDEKGRTHEFEVKQKTDFPTDTFPINTVFGSTDSAQLNLITCAGTWDRNKSTYDERLVVFSKLVE